MMLTLKLWKALNRLNIQKSIKRMLGHFFSGLYGKEFKEEDLPVELQTFEKKDTNG